jgi:anti-sigma regulatory factor (Ser/Thr protein kinase)
MRGRRKASHVWDGNMPAEPDAVNLQVPFQAPSASVVRRELRSWLEQKGFQGETVDDARVVVSELVGNSVRHAAPLGLNEIAVSWSLEGDDLVISVSDGGGTTTPQVLSTERSAISGRGLSIVEALVDRWWVDNERGQTTVHVRIPLDG